MGPKESHRPPPPGRPRCVAEVMRRDFVTISAEEPLSAALGTMRMARLRHLIVVEKDGRLAGVLSYRDLQERELNRLARVAAPRPPPVQVVEEAMTQAPYIVTPDTPLELAAARMCQLRIGCLPVVVPAPEGAQLVGVLTESDLLGAAYTTR